MSIVKALVHLDCLAQLIYGFVILARPDVSRSQISVDYQRERIQVLRSFQLRYTFIKLADGYQIFTIPMADRRIVRIQRQGSLQCFSGFFELPFIAPKYQRQSGMRVSQTVIDRQRFCRRRSCSRRIFLR